MIALSCFESSLSIWAIRALIMAWASFDTVMVPAMTCSTNSPIRSFASARCSSSRASLPCEMIWSRRLTSCVSAADEDRLCSAAPLLMSGLLFRLGFGFRSGRRASGLGAQLLERVGIADHVEKQLFELLVAVHL